MTNSRNEILQADTGSQAARQRLAVAGGLLGALAATSCCILPLVLFSLGAGGAWVGNLTALAPYQPIFVALALGFIGYGYWLVYRRPTAACAKGDACARPLPKRSVKLGLWAATFIIAAALAFPFVAPILLEI
ncbi:mercuric transporter MerT family protein [Mesorhizobium sp. AaZ16]|uniref:mercuric transporter MerT family protein n=1 Tax=Mesorhizobium sp. AaZ16 TaxID=3402289 RepID=UPI00374FC145